MKLKLASVRDGAGRALLHDEFHYTINRTRDGQEAMVVKQVAPPAEKTSESEGWLHLTWGDALDRWQGEGCTSFSPRAAPRLSGAWSAS